MFNCMQVHRILTRTQYGEKRNQIGKNEAILIKTINTLC